MYNNIISQNSTLLIIQIKEQQRKEKTSGMKCKIRPKQRYLDVSLASGKISEKYHSA